MNIFVTGGAGFIGKHLVENLVKSGNEVTVFDNFSNSVPEKLSNIAEKINVIEADVTDYYLLTKSLEGFDAVVHLAAKISVSESLKNQK